VCQHLIFLLKFIVFPPLYAKMCISSYAPDNRFMGHCRVVGHWHESGFLLPLGCLEFVGGIYIFGKLWAPT
jgi:hypothetical protein